MKSANQKQKDIIMKLEKRINISTSELKEFLSSLKLSQTNKDKISEFLSGKNVYKSEANFSKLKTLQKKIITSQTLYHPFLLEQNGEETLKQVLNTEFPFEINSEHWKRISMWQELSENFIREFQDKVDWDNISRKQKLSEPFIIEFKHRLNLEIIAKNHKLSESTIKAIGLKPGN